MSVRVLRVEKSLRDIIAERISRGLGDIPRGIVTITRVQVTKDLRIARVYVSVFTPDGETAASRKETCQTVLDSLGKSRQELVREANKQLRMKHIPHFDFFLDEGLEKMAHISSVLDGIRHSGGSTGEPTGGSTNE